MSVLKEKCAVAAAVASEGTASSLVHDTLSALQHRGFQATGTASQAEDGSFRFHRGEGRVCQVYSDSDIQRLAGSIAIGHNRYSTNGSSDGHAQPVLDEDLGLAVATNGNLAVTDDVKAFLGRHQVPTGKLIDTEMMGGAIAHYIRRGKDLPDAIELAYPLFRGAFSSVAMHDGLVVAFRDPAGIRPLALGKRDDGFVVASETCGLDSDTTYQREIEPGEMVIITKDGVESRHIATGIAKLDIFELIYFASPNSILYGLSVRDFRYKCGQELATLHPPIVDNAENILVVPVPKTSIPAAEGYAHASGLKYEEALIKNQKIGRTFMQPRDVRKRTHQQQKYNLVADTIKGKDIILVDDSIVRLNTLPRLVARARHAGASTVSVLIASPPVRFPDFYGIDTPQQSELAAANMTIEEIRFKIGCDYLGYLPLSRMIEATGFSADRFNLSIFNGKYPIDIGENKNSIKTPVSWAFAD